MNRPTESGAPSPAQTSSGAEMGSALQPSLISRLNKALTALWPQLMHKGEPVELSERKAAKLVDGVVAQLRASGEIVPGSLSSVLKWHLTTCFSVDNGGLRGIHGMFGATSKVACPGGSTVTCILTALGIPAGVEEQTESQAFEASVLADAFRHIGHDAAATAASSRGPGVGVEQVRELALGEIRISQTDQETQALFIEGIRSQLGLQKGFQALQWFRFSRFHQLASALRLAQRLFYEPDEAGSPSESSIESHQKGSIWEVMKVVACTAKQPCLGINEPGFQNTVDECAEAISKGRLSSPLGIFFRGTSTTKQGSLAAQTFASCSPEVAASLESHLQALGGLDAIRANPVLFASTVLENATLFFSLNGVPPPDSLAEDYEALRQSGTKFGLALVRGASKMISTAYALREFISSASKLSETLRAAASVAGGALDLSAQGGSAPLRLLDALQQFGNKMEDNLLHVGMSFLEDGEFSLYGPLIHERIISTTQETSFIRTQARQLFVYIQSQLDNPSESVQRRFSTPEGLQAYITEYLAQKVGRQEQEGEEAAFGATKYSGETIALANAVLKELQRIFAKLTVATDAFQKAQQKPGMRVGRWLKGVFSDFRKDMPPSYLVDAAFGCLQLCTGPLLADKRLQTKCRGSQGGPQPLGKCADPAEEFQRIINKEFWENYLPDWLAQSQAPAACAELMELQEEDPQAWQRQVYLMFSHLDAIGCGKDHRQLDSFGRYSIKLEIIQHLYEMFVATAKRPTLENFIGWLIKLREPLPQDLQTPTALALQYAGGHPQTQVRVSKAFNLAVKGDPFYAQCKPEDTKIISELIGSLGNIFYTLGDFDTFVKERRSQEEVITRQVTAPLAAKARPILSQIMMTYTSTSPAYPEAVIRYPVYFSATAAGSLSQLGMKSMWVLVYLQNVLGEIPAGHLPGAQDVEHFLDAAVATESWTDECLKNCDRTCSIRFEGETGIFITISETAAKPYTFPATAAETLAAGVFGWSLPTFPALPCQKPNRKVIPIILPIPPPTLPPVPEPSKEGEPEKEPEAEPSPPPPPPPTPSKTTTVAPPEQRTQPPEITGSTEIPVPAERISKKKKVHKKIDVVKTENKDAAEPEEMITLIPPKPDVSPKMDKAEDACMQVVRLYERYIEGSAIKDVASLHEAAMNVPLFKSTRKQLGIKEDDYSLQKFRLVLCVTCAKFIPSLQLATGEEREQLKTSIEKSKEACGMVYEGAQWAQEIEGGTPLASLTPNSPVTSSVQLNLQVSAISHRLLGGVQSLLQAAGTEGKAIEACAAAEVLGRSLQDAKCHILRKSPEITSPLLLALGGVSRAAAKRMRHHKLCTKITADLAAIFGSAASAGGRRVPPTTMAGGLRNWLPQEGGLKAWAEAAHKKLKSDKSVAALCAALRFGEFMRLITKPGVPFDRMLSHWNLVFPSNGLPLVNALRSASSTKQALTHELCVLTPPGQDVQQLPRRFDAAQWAAMMLQTLQEGEAAKAGM
ncbi:hypothetical protein, conserved [Eimeria brunetti]|uniref:Uncharacterized protein n=1 Tax=Eimeria brunetti TaxID=51314 RepID=U6LRP7_9EIME|nr:hypothetical protein, conserved [Eimeria brunetti]